MRTGQTSRPYGRNYGNNANRNRQQMPPRGQNLDSNGPNVKIRGTPHQIFERYIALAREASTSGDRVAAENLYQHAEHYFRIMNAAGEGQAQGQPRPTTPADNEMGSGEMGGDGQPRDDDEGQAHVQSTQPPPAPPSDEQPPYRDEQQPPYGQPYEPPRSY